MINLNSTIRRLMLISLACLAAACGGPVDEELLAYIDEVKGRPGGRIEALPQIKPYESFQYEAEELRSPFLPDRPDAPTTTSRPLEARSKEYLEQFPLDTLDMVGTLDRQGRTYGLVKTQDGMVHRVMAGNYIGQNDGRIIAVNTAVIQLEELVPDGIGGFYKRSAEIGLTD
ncbi:MAG: pilus assembly protein PilP [Gammaproteobacteria bacterium]